MRRHLEVSHLFVVKITGTPEAVAAKKRKNWLKFPEAHAYLVREQVSSWSALTVSDLSWEESIEDGLEGQPGEEDASSVGREGGDLADQKLLQSLERVRRVVDLKSRGGHGALVGIAGDVRVHDPQRRQNQNSERHQNGAEGNIYGCESKTD